MKNNNQINIPLTVHKDKVDEYIKNYSKATFDSGKLFLFAGDQKIEHLNKDFYGKDIPKECATPKHFFEIASKPKIGAFATQLGLIASYGQDYKNINYVVKLNSKTDLVSTKQSEPFSGLINTVDDVLCFKENSELSIVGVGYTIYLGSEYEAEMLQEASQSVFQAHENGLIAILWIYPRGKAIKDELDADLIAGAAGVAACLGADFVKVNPPEAKDSLKSAELLKQATFAAGKTKVICSGGKKIDEKSFLEQLYNQINIGGAKGCAVGRNIHQKSLDEAIEFCNKIYSVVIEGKKV